VIAEDIYGEPHYSQIRDGMLRKRPSSPSRYTVSLACGNLQKPRYINPKIEEELKEFKQEIAQKFKDSVMNRTFKFPRMSLQDGDAKVASQHR
jgi:hypothetical protein